MTFWLLHAVISFAATVGFGVITNIPARTLLPAGGTGALAWLVYVAATQRFGGVVMPNLLAALTIGLVANELARHIHAPVNLLYIPSLVSLVPGALIYESMKDFTLGHTAAAQGRLVQTLTIGMALAAGFVIAEAVVARWRQFLERKR